MSVALIAHYRGPRLGIGQYLERLLPPLVEELMSRRTEIEIFGSPNGIENTPALGKLKDLVRVLPPLDYPPAKRYAWFATRFAKYCSQKRVKVVVWLSNPIVLPWHPPTMAVIHDVNEWKEANKYGDRLKTFLRSAIYLDSSIRFASKIIAVSQATKSDLLRFRPDLQLELKVRAIANGTDSELVNLPPVSIPAPTAPFLLSVGRIDPVAKRLPAAVALVSALREISGVPWELHLIGGMNASTQASGEAFLRSMNLLSWVHYHGYINDLVLAEWYRRATAVVFLSDNEGFGLPIAEAASFDRWVIVSQTNLASTEAGNSAIIPVNPDDAIGSATTVLHRLGQEKPPAIGCIQPQWQATATAYAEEICALLA